MKDCRTICALVVATLLYAVPAHAQLSGSNITGDFGLKSGSQAPPGVYLGYFLYNYGSSKLVGQDGRELSFDRGDIDAWAHAAIISVVTGKKFLGATYGATIIPSVMDLSIEAPRIALGNLGLRVPATDVASAQAQVVDSCAWTRARRLRFIASASGTHNLPGGRECDCPSNSSLAVQSAERNR